MNDNNKLPKQVKPQEFELIELLFQEYISSHIARPDIEYSFQARFQSFINQIPSYLHSSSKTGFFTHFFFGSFSSLLDTKLGQKLVIQKLHFNFDQANHLRIVAEADDKTHVFIFTENNQKKKHHKKKKLNFTKDEWKTITGQEYTDDDNKKLEINIININKSIGRISTTVEKKNIQDGYGSTRQYNAITKQCVDNDGQYIALENEILTLSVGEADKSKKAIKFILKYIKRIHDHYQGLPYGAGAKEAGEHGFVAGIFNNFRYRENAHVYLEQFAGKGYADIVLLVRGADRATKSIPIIIELKADTGPSTNADDALRQVEEYTKGFQPNNMRILSLSDHILCVGVNLDMPTDSFIQTQVVARDQVVAPLIQQIINQLVTEDILNQNPTPDDLIVIQQTIKQYLEQTYNTFPGTGEKSSPHYMSRFILGESLVLRDYDKHIFIYDKESYIPTATVINDHGMRSNKKPKIERTVDGSNAVNSILFIPTSSVNSPAILVNIIDVNRDVVVNNVRLDSGLIGNRKIVQLNIQINIDKYKESFAEYCNIKLLKIYDSISEYNQASIQVQGKLHLIAEDISDNLLKHLQQTISSQAGLVISESHYKELIGKIGEVVYPVKSLIGRESEFQGLLEGIFKYYSDVKLSEGSERRKLVLTELQTGAGGRIDMLVQAIGSSEQGTKEYIPVGLELKYDNSIKLDSRGRKQDENIQKILLEGKEKQVVEKLLQDQTERYSKGAAIKSITDGNKVVIIGVVFNGQAQEPSKLFLTTNKFLEANIVHSSKLYTVHGVVVPNINDLPPADSEGFIPDWVEQEILDEFAKIQGEDETLLSLFNKNIDDDKIIKLQNVLQHKEQVRSIDGIDLSFNKLTAKNILGFVKTLSTKLIYLDLSDNDLAKDNFADFKELIKEIEVPILKISDIGMQNKQMQEVIMLLKKQDKVAHLEIQHLKQKRMNDDTANSIGKYIAHTNMLEYLDLSKCGIHNVAARIIANNLYEQNTLKTLILSDNRISVEGARELKAILSQSEIYHLDLSGNPLGIDGFANIVEGVVSSSSNVKVLKLVNVGVKYDKYNREQVKHLENAIKSLFSNTKLTSVDISYHDIGTDFLSQIFDILSKARHDHSLSNVSLAGNTINWRLPEITIATLQARIGQFLKKNKTIRSLNMADMDLDDELGQEIATGLEKSSLIHLDLSGNVDIGKKTISTLAKTLSTHQYLKYLNLSDIKCSVKRLKVLLTGLKLNQDLTHLNLSHNDLSGILHKPNGDKILNLDQQNIDFKNLLQGNTSLKYLNLNTCQLSSKSLKSLFAFAKESSSLEVLDIRGNNLDNRIVDYILRIENANKGFNNLKILYININNLSDESVTKLKSLGISVLSDDYLSSDVEISDLGQKECTISHINSKVPTIFQDIPPLTLEEATNQGIYDYWLQQHDIPDISRVHYNYQVHELEVIGSNDQLSYVLSNYRSSKSTHPFTIIMNIGQDGNRGDHWVSMVLHRVNNQYNAYYTDSLKHKMSSSTASILNNNGILIHDMSIMQQSDGHNCGLWALENARAIRNHIIANQHPEIFSLPMMNQEALEGLRRAISDELLHDNARINNIEQYNLAHDNRVIPSNYFSNSDVYQQSALLLEKCIKTFAMLHSTPRNMPKYKRSIINDKQKINIKEFLECTDQMKTDITNFQLKMLLQKFQIMSDGNCDKVNEFILVQQTINEIKQRVYLGVNANMLVQDVPIIILSIRPHDIDFFKLMCKRHNDKLNEVDKAGQTVLHKVVLFSDSDKWVEFLINQEININIKDKYGNTALDYASKFSFSYNYLVSHDAHKGIELNNKGDIISSTTLPTTTTSTMPPWWYIRYGDDSELRKKRADLEIKDNNQAQKNHGVDCVFEESELTTRILSGDSHTHREGNEKDKHPINKYHIEDHYRGRRALEDVLSIKDKKQDDKLVAAQEDDSRYDTIVQVYNAIGMNHKIEQDASKFIGSNAYPVVNSVTNKMAVDWQGNLLLWYLFCGKKWGVTKCKTSQDVYNDPKDLEYAHRLAYSSYAPSVEKQEEDIELVGAV